MIHVATMHDLEAIVTMGEHFIRSTEYADRIACNTKAIRHFVQRCLSGLAGESQILLALNDTGVAVGMIGVLVSAHPFSGERVAGELFWWVEPAARGHGLRLLRAAEQWARDRRAVRFQMIAPNARVARMYRRLGYTVLESTFQRSLT